MKKTGRILAAALILALTIVLLAMPGAGAEVADHTHTYSEAWEPMEDGVHHGHKCTVEGCSWFNPDSVEEHTGMQDGECDLCGAHVHSYTEKWSRDETNHWKVCVFCTEVVAETEAAHSFIYMDQGDGTHRLQCVCGLTQGEAAPHSWKYTDIESDAHTRSCGTCEIPPFTEAHTMEDKYDAEGHWTECACGYKTEKEAHDLKNVPAVAPTCAEDGHEAYDYCQREGCDYSTPITVLKATGQHISQPSVYKAPTCTEKGYQGEEKCAVCGEELKQEAVIPATGHQLKMTAAVEKTCTQDGNSAYWTCTSCGKFFEDSGGNEEIEEGSWVTKAGHVPGEPVKENEKAPQPGAAGSYDWVVYCTACGAEISRETVQTDPLPVPEYTVTFKNYDGTVLQSSKWKAGETPVFSDETPTRPADKYTYSFSGWDPEIAAVTGDTTYTAKYTYNDDIPTTYTVTFWAKAGDAFETQSVLEGDKATSPQMTPKKTGYRFVGWGLKTENGIVTYNFNRAVNENIDLFAMWEKKSVEEKAAVVQPDIATSIDPAITSAPVSAVLLGAATTLNSLDFAESRDAGSRIRITWTKNGLFRVLMEDGSLEMGQVKLENGSLVLVCGGAIVTVGEDGSFTYTSLYHSGKKYEFRLSQPELQALMDAYK